MRAVNLKRLTERDLDTLGELRAASDSARKHDPRPIRADGFVQVMDVGGYDASHHSKTLTKLVRRGLAEVWAARDKQPWRSRYAGGRLYRITERGRSRLEQHNKTRSDHAHRHSSHGQG